MGFQKRRPVAARQASASVTHIGVYEVVQTAPGRTPLTLRLDPAEFGPQGALLTELGPAFVRYCRERPGRVERATGYLRDALRLWGEQHVVTWDVFTPNMLRGFEADVTGRWAARSARDRLDVMWSVLLHLPDDVLPAETRRFLGHPPMVSPGRKTPQQAFSEPMLKQMLKVSMRLVATAEWRIEHAVDDSLDRFLRHEEVVAFYILLLFELSWSMDVLKYLTFDGGDIVTVTDWGEPDPDDPKGLTGGAVVAKWLKLRARGRADTYVGLCDSMWRGGTLLRRLRNATAPTRAAVDPSTGLDAFSPWICLKPGQLIERYRGARQAVGDGHLVRFFDLRAGSNNLASLAGWLAKHDIAVPDEYDDDISYRAIRPAAKAFRHVERSRDTRLLGADLVDDHTLEVYSQRYMRSEIIMRKLGEIFLTQIAGNAETVARELRPTVVLNSDTVLGGVIDKAEATSILNGEREAGLTACRNPRDSPLPGQRKGALCGVAFRACFTCPNALVAPQHYTRMLRVREVAMQQRDTMSPPEWQATFEETIKFIDGALPLLKPHVKDSAQLPATLVDLGMRASPEW
jgi:hypothetical protein